MANRRRVERSITNVVKEEPWHSSGAYGMICDSIFDGTVEMRGMNLLIEWPPADKRLILHFC